MTKTVTKTVTVTSFCNDISGGLIHFLTCFSGFYSSKASQLCFQNHVVDLFLFIIGFSDYYSSCHIRAVSLILASEIHRYKVSGFQFLSARNRMWHRGVQSGSNNSIKSEIFCSCFFHLIFQFCCHFQFTDSRFQKIQDPGKCNITDMLCLCQIFDFFCSFDSAKCIHFSPHRHPLFNRKCFFHLVELVAKQRLIFVSDCQCAFFFFQTFYKNLLSGMSAMFLNNGKITFFFCLFRITGICNQDLLGGRYVQCTLSSAETTDVSHVIGIGDDHSPQSFFFNKLLCFTHDAFLPFCPRSSSLYRSILILFYTASSACARSAIKSSTSSIPTERRIRSGRTPASISCSSFSCLWVWLAGCRTQVRASAT